MLYKEDRQIMLGGVTLPGALKKLEIKPSAIIEEVTVEGSSSRPKQAVGYEDCKISIELIIDDTPYNNAADAIAEVRSIFRKNNSQKKPQPVEIVSAETAIFDISKVLVKEMNLKRDNKTNQYSLSLELWEYIPAVITVQKSSWQAAAEPLPLSSGYQSYLQSGKGKAPVTEKSPAQERPPSTAWMYSYLERR